MYVEHERPICVDDCSTSTPLKSVCRPRYSRHIDIQHKSSSITFLVSSILRMISPNHWDGFYITVMHAGLWVIMIPLPYFLTQTSCLNQGRVSSRVRMTVRLTDCRIKLQCSSIGAHSSLLYYSNQSVTTGIIR
jgi:hypothetical protein